MTVSFLCHGLMMLNTFQKISLNHIIKNTVYIKYISISIIKLFGEKRDLFGRLYFEYVNNTY